MPRQQGGLAWLNSWFQELTQSFWHINVSWRVRCGRGSWEVCILEVLTLRLPSLPASWWAWSASGLRVLMTSRSSVPLALACLIVRGRRESKMLLQAEQNAKWTRNCREWNFSTCREFMVWNVKILPAVHTPKPMSTFSSSSNRPSHQTPHYGIY